MSDLGPTWFLAPGHTGPSKNTYHSYLLLTAMNVSTLFAVHSSCSVCLLQLLSQAYQFSYIFAYYMAAVEANG